MAETNIEFDTIPTSIRQPGVYTEYNARNAVSTLPTNEQNVLIVAPMLNATKAFSQYHSTTLYLLQLDQKRIYSIY